MKDEQGRNYTPPIDPEVARVMQQTGMQQMQAYYHVQGRRLLRERLNARR